MLWIEPRTPFKSSMTWGVSFSLARSTENTDREQAGKDSGALFASSKTTRKRERAIQQSTGPLSLLGGSLDLLPNMLATDRSMPLPTVLTPRLQCRGFCRLIYRISNVAKQRKSTLPPKIPCGRLEARRLFK